jgi:hypothetical protein
MKQGTTSKHINDQTPVIYIQETYLTGDQATDRDRQLGDPLQGLRDMVDQAQKM